MQKAAPCVITLRFPDHTKGVGVRGRRSGCYRAPGLPAVLLKIYIYGYLNRIASSRRLEREAQQQRRAHVAQWAAGA